MRSFWHNTRGTVLLEVVLTMPLHILLFLATAWLGQLSLDRIYVAEMDLAVAIAKGIGNPSTALETYGLMYFKEGSATQVTEKIGEETAAADTWWKLSRSRVKVFQDVPVWVQGIDAVIKYSMGLGETIDNGGHITTDYETTLQSIVAQGTASTSDIPTTTVLATNSGYSRDRATSKDWSAIASEALPYGDAPAAQTQNTVDDYTRIEQFVTWSE